MKKVLWLICALLLGMPVMGSAEEPCQPRGVAGGLACVNGEGERRWEVHHPSLWDEEEQYLEVKEGPSPVGPVTVEGRVFYGVRGDLLEVDAEAGRVVGRSRLAATITGLEESDGSLKVDLNLVPEWPLDAEAVALEMVLRLDRPIHSQTVWYGQGTVHGRMATRRDADWLVSRLEKSEEHTRVGRLVQAWEADPTNLYLLAALTSDEQAQAFLDHRLPEATDNDPEEVASAAIAVAEMEWREVLSDGALRPWQDLIAVSWKLERSSVSRRVGADVFEAGYAGMLEAGIEPERITNLVSFALLHMDGADAVRERVGEGNVGAVSELVDRMARTAPLVEGAEFAWPLLATWLEAQGGDGALWRERAKYHDEQARSFSSAAGEAADRLIAVVGGMMIALVLSSLAVGMASGRRRRRMEAARPGENHPWWRLAVRARDVVGLLLLMGALQVAATGLTAHMTVINVMVEAPLGLFDDTLSAPGVDEWLAERGEFGGEAKFQELIEIAERERAAMLEGRVLAEKEQTSKLLYDALVADAWGYQWELMKSAQLTNPFVVTGALGDLESQEVNFFVWWIPFVLSLMGLLFIGALIGGLITPLATWYLRVLPGAAEGLAPAGPLLMGGALAAIAAYFGADSILMNMAHPEFSRFFGLERVPAVVEHKPERGWAVAALLIAVVAQAAAAAWEIRYGGSGD